MPDKKVIGARLKDLRKKKRLTQEQLAEIVGITRESISQYENGDKIPTDDNKVKIAKALGRSVSFIFFKT